MKIWVIASIRHKYKWLEDDNIQIAKDIKYYPNKEQNEENNICYVALTRGKKLINCQADIEHKKKYSKNWITFFDL